MNTKAKLARRKQKNPALSLTEANIRLKKLRSERVLVKRTILALTELFRVRHPSDRRPSRN
jgi:hypothetical protein